MKKNVLIFLTALFAVLLSAQNAFPKMKEGKSIVKISREELLDKLYGGWVGMLIGGLEGLAHEFKYKDQPRESLPDFKFLPNGARTDDDNDFELTHIYFMDKENVLKLPYDRVAQIWKANMRTGLWAANLRARILMDSLSLVPPATGSFENNPIGHYNLSAQFCMESYGLISPGMPKTAAEIGIHYAHISVCCEPIQAAQFWTSLISLNMVDKSPIEKQIEKALQSVDPKSVMHELVNDAISAYHNYPDDWKVARQLIYNKWLKEKKWNANSTPTNGGMVILSVLYGHGDFYKTLQYAMAFGIDADCNAATAGVIAGSKIGFSGISKLPGFAMPDYYVNKTRPQLPAEMKISEQAELLMRVCEKVILDNGGKKIDVKGKPGYLIKLQNPVVQEYLNNK
jgi:ADP-ribosylglycohydrolase